MLSRTISVAPMMGWTDRHARYFLRLITKHTLLYTEMVTTGAVLHGQRETLLKYHPAEHPLALQLGGSGPAELAECAQIAEDLGFDEINLNVGCPSDRVQSGRFGACLMAEPQLVADCVAAMNSRVRIPVTVKCRIGIDDMEDYASLEGFIDTVAATGCDTFIVHARKAWLKGLSPKQNRDIPPLRYDLVYQLKQSRPGLNIIINGGIKSLDETAQHLQHVDGVMLGREAYHNPFMLSEVDRRFYQKQKNPVTREQVVEQLVAYIDEELRAGTRLHSITRHIYGLFAGMPGARNWRRELSTSAHTKGADSAILERAMLSMLSSRAA
ncbi:MAG: tRNA dihydrouridine(20/20a) synthase DusA [Gammaproteobacteria bacterium]